MSVSTEPIDLCFMQEEWKEEYVVASTIMFYGEGDHYVACVCESEEGYALLDSLHDRKEISRNDYYNFRNSTIGRKKNARLVGAFLVRKGARNMKRRFTMKNLKWSKGNCYVNALITALAGAKAWML